jgi:hypothetical protein
LPSSWPSAAAHLGLAPKQVDGSKNLANLSRF